MTWLTTSKLKSIHLSAFSCLAIWLCLSSLTCLSLSLSLLSFLCPVTWWLRMRRPRKSTRVSWKSWRRRWWPWWSATRHRFACSNNASPCWRRKTHGHTPMRPPYENWWDISYQNSQGITMRTHQTLLQKLTRRRFRNSPDIAMRTHENSSQWETSQWETHHCENLQPKLTAPHQQDFRVSNPRRLQVHIIIWNISTSIG